MDLLSEDNQLSWYIQNSLNDVTSLGMILLNTITLIFFSCVGTRTNNQEYLVNTKKCKIPNIDPFCEEVKPYIQKYDYLQCNESELLTYTTKTNNVIKLHIKEELTKNLKPGNFSCSYANVTRNKFPQIPDYGIQISSFKIFEKDLVLGRDPIMVKCTLDEEEVYENVHNPILVVDEIIEKKPQNSKTKPLMSVLFIVVDSLSRINFIRMMPETYKFFRHNNFLEMKGYNKIGLNTYPNFMALLTGLSPKQQISAKKLNQLDQSPMIWYDYRDFGYVTAYAEDYDSINTFTYNDKKGFNQPPTDYYFKSYIAAAEKLKQRKVSGGPFCTGPESSGERILNLARDFTDTFKDYPTFGIFWMNTFSHDNVNMPAMMDNKMEQFFRNIKENGVLDESFVIFLSDHGFRMGPIKYTRSGWYEERLPVNFISVPEKFQKMFEKEYNNLQTNSKKFTNTYDLHMTLQHILSLSNASYQIKPSPACPKCLSLFEEIEDRSCEEACIPLEYCTCDSPSYDNISTYNIIIDRSSYLRVRMLLKEKNSQN